MTEATIQWIDAREIPLEVFDALVRAWADVLVADYQRRHRLTSGLRYDAASTAEPVPSPCSI